MGEDTVPLLEEEQTNSKDEVLFSRRFARFMSNFRWYHPKRDEREGPHQCSLEDAWLFFERFTLGRYGDPVQLNQDPSDIWEKAPPGEGDYKTYLYPIFCPERQLAGYGTGILMYFTSTRWLSFILFGAFIINLPLYLYFRSDQYSDMQEGLSFALQGSAACTVQDWMPCPDCFETGFLPAGEHYAEAKANSLLKFVKINECSSNFGDALYSLIATAFVLTALLAMRYYEKKEAVRTDELQQTASDYSVRILKPPKDARDPEEWKTFFSGVCEEAHLTVCTIALDNEKLVRTLALRKTILLQIDYMLPPGMVMDESNLKELVEQIPSMPWWKKIFSTSADTLYEKAVALDASIDEMSKKEYDVVSIVATFEKERDQRKVLERLSFGSVTVDRQQKDKVPPEYLFRGERVLSICEPEEPNSMRWQDMDTSISMQRFQMFCTLIISIILIALGAGAIEYCAKNIQGVWFGYTASAALITFFNVLTPMLVGYLVNFESHTNVGSRETSLFIKICLFRWTNTAIILYLTTPFTRRLESDTLITLVYSLFFTEITTTPILQLSDYYGNYQRHIVAPRAPDQRRMMQCFEGTPYSLSERYTSMNKVLFLALFYASIFPAGLLLGSISLMVHYWVDKYSLLRLWKQNPPVGTQLTRLSTKFNGLAMVFYVITTFLAIAQFPYDNACVYDGDDATDILTNYVGKYFIEDGAGHITQVKITPDDTVYTFCNQDLLDFKNISFPFEWMSPLQSLYTRIFAWTTVAIFIISVFLFLTKVAQFVAAMFSSSYKPSGTPGDERFSKIDESAYIPQMKIPGYIFPFLFCQLIDVPDSFLGWEHDDDNFQVNNLMYDIPAENAKKDDDLDINACIFSLVKYWDPPPFTEEE